MTSTFEQDVSAVYAWVDEQVRLAAPRCEISGRCCRFREFGHRLYISGVEADRLAECPLPEGIDPLQVTQQSVREQCPYQVQGRCTAREFRPLGCRIYFCDPAYDVRAGEITEAALLQLKGVYQTHGREWCYQELSEYFANGIFRGQ